MENDFLNYILLHLPVKKSIDFSLKGVDDINIELKYISNILVGITERKNFTNIGHLLPFPVIPHIYHITPENIHSINFGDDEYDFTFGKEYFINDFEEMVKTKSKKEDYKELLENRKKYLTSFLPEYIKSGIQTYKQNKYKFDEDGEIIKSLEKFKKAYEETEKLLEQANENISILETMSKTERKGIDISLEDLRKLKDKLQSKLQLLQKRIERYSRMLDKVNFLDNLKEGQEIKMKKRDSPIKLSEQLLYNIEHNIDTLPRIDFRLYEKLWNDRENYGPIISMLILVGTIKNGIDMRALMNMWISFRERIKEIAKKLKSKKSDIPLFVRIYEHLVTYDTECVYTSYDNNFISDLYITGKCNCQCGSYLGYILWQMYPENCYCFATTNPEHIFLTVFRDNKLYNFETTEVSDYFIELDKLPEDISGMFRSEQILALHPLMRLFREEVFNMSYIMYKFFGTGLVSDGDIKKLRDIDITPAKSPLDLLNLLDVFKCPSKILGKIYRDIFGEEIYTQINLQLKNIDKVYTQEELKIYWNYILDMWQEKFPHTENDTLKEFCEEKNKRAEDLFKEK